MEDNEVRRGMHAVACQQRSAADQAECRADQGPRRRRTGRKREQPNEIADSGRYDGEQTEAEL